MDTPLRIAVDGGDQITIEWETGPATVLTAAELRAACPCAGCRGGAGPGPAESRIGELRLVGGYALGVTFEPDGHATGIFAFSYLRGLGPLG